LTVQGNLMIRDRIWLRLEHLPRQGKICMGDDMRIHCGDIHSVERGTGTMKKVGLFFLFVMICSSILTGCVFTKTKTLPEECLAKNMLISKEDIGAQDEGEPSSPMPDEPVNSVTTDFTIPGRAYIFIIQHKDKNIEKAYQSRIDFVFRIDENHGPWKKPDDIGFTSTLADEFEYRCGLKWNTGRCTYVARYKNYLVNFGLTVDTDEFSMDNFEAGMIAIEREMAQCFAALESAEPAP